MSSSMGVVFRITTWGESHGGAVGVVIDGCPPRLPLTEADIQPQLDRRRPGQSRLTSPRGEADRVRILSGVFEGRTLGTPILLLVENTDARPEAYEAFRRIYRPSHADFTYDAKYGFRSWQGGGRASARETVGRVAAGAVAEKILRLALGMEVVAWVRQVGEIDAVIEPTEATPTRDEVDRTPVRCPDPEAAARMIAAIDRARREGDSLGGVTEAVVRGVPAGLGEPVFDRLEADLGKALLSLPACKGFEIGSGFAGTRLRGSEHNDPFYARAWETASSRPSAAEAASSHPSAADAASSRPTAANAASTDPAPRDPDPEVLRRIGTRTNRSGGVQGGISNGEPILVRAAFKPTATIRKPQETVSSGGEAVILEAQGRHDPCVLPRAVPLVEAMIALVLVDHWLRQLAIEAAASMIERDLR